LAAGFFAGAFLATGLARVVFALPPALTLRVLLLPFFCVAIAQMS